MQAEMEGSCGLVLREVVGHKGMKQGGRRTRGIILREGLHGAVKGTEVVEHGAGRIGVGGHGAEVGTAQPPAKWPLSGTRENEVRGCYAEKVGEGRGMAYQSPATAHRHQCSCPLRPVCALPPFPTF